nr:hypothetical protein [Marinicella sp. W31]MDC2879817.1 hypothetical protein [Marinicella sp. W31]
MRPDGVRIAGIEWSTADLMAYLAEKNMRNRAIAAAEAVNRLLSGAERSFGYDIEAMREDPKQFEEPAFRPAVPLALLRKLERLFNLPESLKHGDPTAYNQARDDAAAMMALLEEDVASYEDPGPLRAELPSGVEMIFEEDGLQPIFVELPLVFTLIDNGREDVDRVELTITDSSGVAYAQTVDLVSGGTRFEPSVRPGACGLRSRRSVKARLVRTPVRSWCNQPSSRVLQFRNTASGRVRRRHCSSLPRGDRSVWVYLSLLNWFRCAATGVSAAIFASPLFRLMRGRRRPQIPSWGAKPGTILSPQS